MKKLRVAVIAGGWFLAALFCARIVHLQNRLAATEARAGRQASVPEATPRRPAAKFPPPSASSPVVPDEAVPANLANTRAELAGAKAELAGARKALEKSRARMDSGHSLDFFPLNPEANTAPVEHWTGGEKRRWGHEQAAGEPDTHQAGDIPSAWASKTADGGEEWVQLDYDRFVDLQQINVIENHNPGAIRKVVAVLSNGREATVWEGTMEPSASDELVSSAFPVAESIRARSVKVYLDTARVPGWNEIDAVQIVGRDGSKQWATASRASSSYADP